MLVRRSSLSLLVTGGAIVSVIFLLLSRSEYFPSIPLPTWGSFQDSPAAAPPDPGTIPVLSSNDINLKPDETSTPILIPPPATATPYTEPIALTSADLVARLRRLLSSPVETYQQALEQNLLVCEKSVHDRQVNPDQYAQQRETWALIEDGDIVARRLAMLRYLEKLEKDGTQVVSGNEAKSTRGIVTTAGNKDTAARLLVTLRLLRKEFKSNLPVEIFSFPGEIKNPRLRDEIAQLGGTLRDLSNARLPDQWKNFQIKAEALVSSSFTEVLYLDSDNIPLRDPSYLFDVDLYKKHGVVFWPDFNKDHPENAIWRLINKRCDHTEWEIDSGQILIDKRGNNGLNLAALHIAAHMQEENLFYFTLSGGDKDTFRYAFWSLDLPYSTAPRWLSSLGSHTDIENGFCGTAMLQYDLIKTSPHSHELPLFVHANILKHRRMVRKGDTFTSIKRAALDGAHEPALDAAQVRLYDHKGMCVDIEIEPEKNQQKVMEESWIEAYGGLFKKFEDLYFQNGGRISGW